MDSFLPDSSIAGLLLKDVSGFFFSFFTFYFFPPYSECIVLLLKYILLPITQETGNNITPILNRFKDRKSLAQKKFRLG